MKPEDWQQIKAQLHDALTDDPALRAGRLEVLAREHPDLRAELHELASSYDEMSPDYLAPAGASWAMETMVEAAASSLIGARMGPYEITERIGSGGMGEVFQAFRADDASRKAVAIKVIRAGHDSPTVLKRFKQERQILASLDHPNIAQLLDGGTSEQGLPYFVMELIEGSRFLEYCEVHNLAVEDRLRLFVAVCRAVHYAHQQGIIHRDIKPSNILVTLDGVPKLLDFGIAKLLDSAIGYSATSSTMSLFRPLTPAYASPEQIKGDPITHSTDIYSLGVVLYELLCGQGPYGMDESSDGLASAVRDSQPVPPSRALESASSGRKLDAATSEESLMAPQIGDSLVDRQKRLRGDLDTIVLTALRKEPERRYASTEAFANDIELHLAGKPIRARGDSITYRAGKFGRRHPVVLFSVSLLLIAAAASLATYRWRAHEAPTTAPASAKSVQVRSSLAVLGFKASSPGESSWTSTAVSEMLNKTMAAGGQLRMVSQDLITKGKIDLALPDAEFYDQKQLSQIRRALDTDFVVFGSYREVSGQLRLDLRTGDTRTGETVASVSESGTAPTLIELALRAGVHMRQRLGLSDLTPSETLALSAAFPRRPEAIRLYAQGLQRLHVLDGQGGNEALLRAVALEPTHALSHAALSNSWSLLGFDNHAADESKLAMQNSAQLARSDQLAIEATYDSAIHRDDKALEVYRTLFGLFPDDIEYGLRLADLESDSGKGKDALATVATLRRLPDPLGQDPRIDLAEARAANATGDFHHEVSAAAEAARKAEADGTRSLIAWAHLRQGVAFRHLKDLAKAAASFQSAKQMYEAIGDERGIASCLNGLGNVLYQKGDLAGARQVFSQAAAVFRKLGDRRELVRVQGNLANVIGDMGDLDGCQKMYEQELTTSREIDSKHEVAETLDNMGTVQVLQGKLSKAEVTFTQAVGIFREVDDLDYVARALDSLGTTQVLLGKVSDALNSFNEEVADFKKVGDEPTVGVALGNRAQALAASGNLSAAVPDLNSAIERTRKDGDQHALGQTLAILALVDLYKGDLPEARKTCEESLSILESIKEKYSTEESRMELAEISLQEGHFDQAESLGRQALKEFEVEHMRDDATIAHALLARTLSKQHRSRDALSELQAAERLAAHSENMSARFEAMLARGEIAKPLLTPQEIRDLESAAAEAHRRGMVPYEYKVRMLLASSEVARGKSIASCARFKDLQNEAAGKGFAGIAKMAGPGCE